MINNSQKHMCAQLSKPENCGYLPIIVDGMVAYKFFRADLLNKENQNQR